MSILTIIFDSYFVSAMCLFWGAIKGLMVVGLWAFIFRGLCKLLL